MPFGVSTGDRVDRILPATQWEIDRLFQIWQDLRAAGRSTEFLCGDFGIVDAMFTPVVFRFSAQIAPEYDALFAPKGLSFPPETQKNQNSRSA